MSKYWGVNCKTCETFIQLGEQDKEESMITYDPSAENLPIVCCGSYLYGTSDVVDEDGVFLNQWQEFD